MSAPNPDQPSSDPSPPTTAAAAPSLAGASAANRLSATAVLACGLSHAFAAFGAGSWTVLVAGSGLSVFFILQWRQIAAIARGTVVVALVLLVFLWASGRIGHEVVETAIGRAAFFTLFIVSLDFLRDAAMTSRAVIASSELIVRQPPGRRYLMLTFGGHLFGILLNLGAVHVLGSMTRRAIEDQRGKDTSRPDFTLQRMTTALMRGFATTTLWSPTSITVAVVVSALHGFGWQQFLPGALLTALTLIWFGWLLDRLTFAREGAPVARETLLSLVPGLLPLVGINAALICCTLALSLALATDLILALLLCVPIFAAIWMVLQNMRQGLSAAIGATGGRLRRQTVPGVVSLRSEVGILAGSGSLGVLLASQKDPEALAPAFGWLGLSDGGVLSLAAASVFALSLVGINPIITVIVVLEVLQALPDRSFSPYLLALLGSVSWSLATGFAPFSATVRLTARNVGAPAHVVGFVWNGPYTLILLAVLCLVLFVLG